MASPLRCHLLFAQTVLTDSYTAHTQTVYEQCARSITELVLVWKQTPNFG